MLFPPAATQLGRVNEYKGEKLPKQRGPGRHIRKVTKLIAGQNKNLTFKDSFH